MVYDEYNSLFMISGFYDSPGIELIEQKGLLDIGYRILLLWYHVEFYETSILRRLLLLQSKKCLLHCSYFLFIQEA